MVVSELTITFHGSHVDQRLCKMLRWSGGREAAVPQPGVVLLQMLVPFCCTLM